jgi:hypothetical protein
MQPMSRPAFAAKLLAVFAVSSALAGSILAEDKHPFKLTLESKMEMDISGKKQAIDAHTEFDYTWQKTAQTRSLIVDSVFIKAGANGKIAMNTLMSRQKFTSVEDGKTTEILFDKAPPALQASMKDSFGVPLLEMQVDAGGKETSRKVIAGPGAKDLLDNGVLANGLLFHPPAPTGQAEWQADSEMSMGNGGYAKGKLTYKKIADRPGDVYAVTGTLSNQNFPRVGTPVVVKDARYAVSGEQTYDTAQKEWASGKLKVDVGFEMTANGKTVGTAKGTIEASMAARK